jgi:hypothetical protein
MERAESEVAVAVATPVFIALPLKVDGAKADVDTARAERMKATVFMMYCLTIVNISMNLL